MAMSIKNAEAERLSRELANLTGESLTTAIVESVRDRLARVKSSAGDEAATKARRAMQTSRGSRALWHPEVLATEHAELLYDDHGFPK